MSQAEGDAFATQCVFGNVVGLRVAQHLHTVFHSTEKYVRLSQFACTRRTDVTARLARRQRGQQSTYTQTRFAAASDQLRQLHDEFDLANATRPELEVVGQILARDFRI